MPLSSANIDDGLLRALHDNGRLSLSALARRIGAPRYRVQQRLDSLLSDGSIHILANVHPGLLGIQAYGHLLIWTDGPAEPVARRIDALPGVPFISLITGEPDIVAELGAGDFEHLNRSIALLRRQEGVARVEVSQHASVFKSRFGTLGDTSSAPPELDRVDSQIVALLREDGRMPYRELGARVRLTPGTARARVQRLLSRGSIRITAVADNTSASRNIMMGLGLNVSDDIEPVAEALQSDSAVEFVASTIGRFDLVATMSAPSLKELHPTIERLRSFQTVNRISSWAHLQVIRESYE